MREEVVSPEGLRTDGRRPAELRRLTCRIQVFPNADGSAYIEQGNTKVLVTVVGPHEVWSGCSFSHPQKIGFIGTTAFNVASFSTGERKQRLRQDRSEITINIQVIQIDGGILHTAINGLHWHLNFIEESSDIPVLTVACLSKSKKLLLASLESRLHLDYLEGVLALASEGCSRVLEVLDSAVKESGKQRLKD
ncbi:ribosomal protein S5 domain 2-type protein [Chytridium lagenaria]|nr:ribosomal protein S5 domain 2-type protein [Chytridium lagenaria]